jgi:hypothetical protein
MSESDGRREIDACRQINFDLSYLFLECNYCINQGVPVFSVKWISEILIRKERSWFNSRYYLASAWMD